MKRSFPLTLCFLLLALALSGCQKDMADQPKYEPLEASSFFPDGRSARPIIADTVTFDHSIPVDGYETGRDANGELLESIPVDVTVEVLERGQEQYDIFCTPCHGYDGTGRGSATQRGFPGPPSFHTGRLREAPAGHFYEVISNGFGLMYAYGDRVQPDDRWAIVAYIRALQLSQNAPLEAVPEQQRQQLEGQQ
jgi:mono/diheme cytochrome c family protein